MAEQRKAATGEHNTVTHELAKNDEQPEVSDAAKSTRKDARVQLRVAWPHVKFDLSAHDLPPVTTEGTYYTSEQADKVSVLALKQGVPVHRVKEGN